MSSNHECPNCNTTLGSLKANGVRDLEDFKEGEKENNHSVCIVCGTFLKVLSVTAGKAMVREMTAEEIGLMPDEERIALTRVSKSLEHIPAATIKEGLERHAKMKALYRDRHKEIAAMLDAKVTEIFGETVGCVLILKDLHPVGFQGLAENLPDGMIVNVLRRALAEFDGTLERIVKEKLGI